MKELFIEDINVSDDEYELVEVCYEAGSLVVSGSHLISYESSKTLVELESPEEGFFYPNPGLNIGDFYDIGFKLGVISKKELSTSELTEIFKLEETKDEAQDSVIKITKKASKLIEENNLDVSIFDGVSVVTEKHVVDHLSLQDSKAKVSKDKFKEDISFEKKTADLLDLLNYLRNKKRHNFDRHVPTGTILNDRQDLAKRWGWGENASVYDECLIFGEVIVGANCWIGPYTVLDGNACPINIGDWTSIGTGAHIYTHHTIDTALSGGNLAKKTAPVKIGKCCFVSPLVMIAPGTEIGDHCFITAHSYVEGSFPDKVIISGNPARIVGEIELRKDKVIKRFNIRE